MMLESSAGIPRAVPGAATAVTRQDLELPPVQATFEHLDTERERAFTDEVGQKNSGAPVMGGIRPDGSIYACYGQPDDFDFGENQNLHGADGAPADGAEGEWLCGRDDYDTLFGGGDDIIFDGSGGDIADSYET